MNRNKFTFYSKTSKGNKNILAQLKMFQALLNAISKRTATQKTTAC